MAPQASHKLAKNQESLWLAKNPAKRWTEIFYLVYSPFWMIWALCVVVPFKLYDKCGSWGYLTIGICTAAPCVILPMFLESKADASKPWHQKYWVKANVWIAVVSYVGNYFWTHYFFKVLGASYTFESFRLNDIPFTLYLMTQAYFLFYHCLSNVVLRRVRNMFIKSSPLIRRTAMGMVVFALAYSTAYMETLTIAHFPHYTFVDRDRMYSVGSLFYAIYFFVTFPMFFRMDEDSWANKWTVSSAFLDGLAASMLVTILLDLWRITVGNITSEPNPGVPWF